MKNATHSAANTKFTAAMVHESDKGRIQLHRIALQLGEKDTMKLILDLADENGPVLKERADALLAAAAKAKADEQELKKAAKAQAAAEKAAVKAKEAAERAAEKAKAAEVPAATTEETPAAAE